MWLLAFFLVDLEQSVCLACCERSSERKLPVPFLRAIVRISEGMFLNMVSSGFVAVGCARVLVDKERMDIFRFLLMPVFCVVLFHAQDNKT